MPVAVVLSGPLRADEAVLTDGRRVEGKLSFAEGRLRFDDTKSSSPFDKIQFVRLTAKETHPLSAAAAHRATFLRDQAATGELLGLDDKELRLRTAWAGELKLPRGAITSLAEPGGWATLWIADLRSAAAEWKLTHDPSFDRGLVLSRIGQIVERTLPTPLAAGRFGIAFRQSEPVAGLRFLVELDLISGKEKRTVRVEVAAPGADYRIETPDGKGPERPLSRSADRHRLEVEFGSTTLVASLDGRALWYEREKASAGSLSAIRLMCVAADKEPPRGVVTFDDASLAAKVTPLRHAAGDPAQDEAWMLNGDGVFGDVPRADRRGVVLLAGKKELTLGWGELRGVFFRKIEFPKKLDEKFLMRVRLRPGTGTALDQIDGIVSALDERTLTLTHPLLGEMKIGREYVDRIGRRSE